MLLTGISYGYVSKIINGSKLNKLTAGILDLDLYEGEELIIENLYPQADPVGLIQEESFDFKLINKTENPTNYILKLQRVETSNELALTDVVYGLTKDNTSSTGLLSELEEANYVVDSGTIKGKETINYELRFWLREDIEDDTTTNNKTLKYTLRVEVSQYLTFNDFFENKVDTKTTIDFKKISSETNGRGIYKYQEDGEDIYYWRGKVLDNHVVFAGYCWEAVRTTSTGGLKIIYDGLPVEVDGVKTCPNTGTASQLMSGSKFNINSKKPSSIGYMYNDVSYEMYSKKATDINQTIIYGNDVEYDYETGKYTLKETINPIGAFSEYYEQIANAHRYTCLGNTSICSEVYYIPEVDSNDLKYIALTDGKTIETIFDDIHLNVSDSKIKEVVENWYELNIEEKGYTNSLEDVVFCNDRTIYKYGGWLKTTTTIANELQYSAYERMVQGTPDLNCRNRNDNRDRFTYKDILNGNGLLKYPVGLLTADEVILAGGQSSNNNDYYLSTGNLYWVMSPSSVVQFAKEFLIYDTGSLRYSNGNVDGNWGVRPVISLSPTALSVLSGAGTETDPYVVN